MTMLLNGLIFNPWSNEINCTKKTKAESPALFPVQKVRKLMPVISWVNIDFSHEENSCALASFWLEGFGEDTPTWCFRLANGFHVFSLVGMGIKINICQCFVDAEGATWAISRVVQGQCMDTTATKQYFFGGKVQVRTRDIEPSQVFWSKVTQQKGPTDYICNQFWIQLYINANLYARYIKIQYVCVCWMSMFNFLWVCGTILTGIL